MKTPDERWAEYRDSVYNMELEEGDELECKMAFFAGAESVFKLLESLKVVETIVPLEEYRELNRAAAMETIPAEDRLIAEIERKSALGEIE